MTRESRATPPQRRGKEDDPPQDVADSGEAPPAVTVLSHQELERLRARLARKYH